MHKVVLVLSLALKICAVSSKSDFDDVFDEENRVIYDGTVPSADKICKFINSKGAIAAKKKVKQREMAEIQESEYLLPDRPSILAYQQTPSSFAAAQGGSDTKVKEIANFGRLSLELQQIMKSRWGISKEDFKLNKLGVYITPDLECMPMHRRKREVETCLYNHDVNCDEGDVYRTMDGTCNNLQYPAWGKSFTPLERFLPSDYADGIQEPRKAKSENALPSARKISIQVAEATEALSHTHTLLHMTIGQLVDHDTDKTANTQTEIDGTFVDIQCGSTGCNTTGPENTACFPIPVPEDDPNYTDRTCLKFVRTQEVMPLNCEQAPREQLNQITSWFDASMVYGSTNEVLNGLRDTSQLDRGKLKTTQHPDKRFKPLLPQRHVPACRNQNSDEGIECFMAGDGRVNEHIGLISLHTMFHRYHNYIEEELHRRNPGWSSEKKFQEARKILIAHWQNFVYHEYLPSVIGPKLVAKYKVGLKELYNDVYNPSVNPQATNSFATAAFRFGHSQVTGNLLMVDKNKSTVKDVPYTEIMRDPNEIYKTQTSNGNPLSAIDAVMLGHFHQRAENSDAFFDKQISFHMFTMSPSRGAGMDLASINIQRGRDHGLPGYNAWRKFCGLTEYTTFDGMTDIPVAIREKFKTLYEHVDDVDLFIAGVSETHLPGALVGPTFGCIIGKNFQRFMHGDRFWFETSNSRLGFNEDQLRSIKKATLSSIFCAAGDSIDNIQKYILMRPRATALASLGNGKTVNDLYKYADMYREEPNIEDSCSSIHQINFNLWKENLGNKSKRKVTGEAADKTISYNPVTGMVIKGFNEYTWEQYRNKFCNLVASIANNKKTLSTSYIACDVPRLRSGSVVFDYVLTFTSDITLSDEEIVSEIREDLAKYPENGLNINAKDFTLGDENNLSAIEILLIVLGCVAALTITTIFVCVCYYYHVNAYFHNARRNPSAPNPYYNYGMDPYDKRSTPMYYPHQATRPRYGYPRNWNPEATRTYYSPEKHLYGHSRY